MVDNFGILLTLQPVDMTQPVPEWGCCTGVHRYSLAVVLSAGGLLSPVWAVQLYSDHIHTTLVYSLMLIGLLHMRIPDL